MNDKNHTRSLFDLDLAIIPHYSQEYGLLSPSESIDTAARIVVKSNYLDCPWGGNILDDLKYYYLFYPVFAALMFKEWSPEYYPFRGWVEALQGTVHLGNTGNLKVLHAGCACEETCLSGYKMIENLFGAENLASFEIIDICSIPVKRIGKFNKLSHFVRPGIKFEANVQDVSHMFPETPYDIIISDRLISTSPQNEYCLHIVNSFRNLIKDGGIIITSVDAESEEALSETPQLSGEACYHYFCHRYGKRGNGHDAKVGLTKCQWDEFASRYFQEGNVKYSSNNFSWFLRNVGDIVNLFQGGGFRRLKIKKLCLKDSVLYEDINLSNKNLRNVEGSFIVCAMK